jgi:hypothetical protein
MFGYAPAIPASQQGEREFTTSLNDTEMGMAAGCD